jgi:TonB family protein
MSRSVFGTGILVLIATVAAGLFSVWIFRPEPPTDSPAKHELTSNGTGSGRSGPGDSGCYPRCPTLNSDEASVPPAALVTSPLKITAKPRAQYTDEARTNNVQGTVRLKITLMANGQVGNITPLNRLPYGLTEQAIAAAGQIKFEPRKVNGVAQSSVVTFEYSFTIY